MRRYNEDWERKKSYLIRSLFNDVPLLSPVPEESDSDGSPRPRSPNLYRPQSPLPPLIIEREPNRHDDPEEFYQTLSIKIRRLYKLIFIDGEEFSDNHDLDINYDDIDVSNDSSNVTTSGYSADFESYESVEAASSLRNESNDNHVDDDVNDERIDDPDENNNTTTHESSNGIHEDNSDEREIKRNDISIDQEEVADSENTEEKSGSDYRQVTTQAIIHVDGTQFLTQSLVYEGSERDIVLMPQGLRREERQVRAQCEEVGSEKSMAETVALEDNDDPSDVDMPNEPQEAEVGHDVEELEVMRTPHPKISVESLVHVAHGQCNVSGEYSLTHHASAMTSVEDITIPTPDLNDNNETIDKNQKKSRETCDTLVVAHASPILNVDRNSKRFEEDITSDMDITSPVCHFNVSFLNEGITERNLDKESRDLISDTRVRATDSHLNVTFNNNNGDEEGEAEALETRVPSLDAPISNEDVIIDVGRNEGRITVTPNLNEKRVAKRRVEMVSVQTATQRVSWEDLRDNLFVGTPKIFRLCSCRDHTCD